MINQNEKLIFSSFTKFQHFDNLECKYFLKGIRVKPFGGLLHGVLCCNLNVHFLTTWNLNAPFCKFWKQNYTCLLIGFGFMEGTWVVTLLIEWNLWNKLKNFQSQHWWRNWENLCKWFQNYLLNIISNLYFRLYDF